MNFNANAGPRQPLGRKLKRVSDVSAMGYGPYTPPNPFADGANANSPAQAYPQQQQVPEYAPQANFDQPKDPFSMGPGVGPPAYAPPGPNAPGANLGMFAQPMVQDMALQYGQQLANTGTNMVKKEIEKFVPVSRLKYYFAVDTSYVLAKLRLLFFPFTHTDWTVKYEQDGPAQPRYEPNAPDLYIPAMAYITYVLVASLVLGMQQRFTPEQIGIQASSALAWCVLELIIYSCTLYIANIATSLRTLDLLAYSGYKFVGIITSILVSLLGSNAAYYGALVYTNFALAFFLVRTLRLKVLPETTGGQAAGGYYGGADGQPAMGGNKRRMYFLLFVAAIQPVLSYWLSFHLLASSLPMKAAD